MSQQIVELYAPERLARMEGRRRGLKRLLWGLALAALALCLVLTLGANTHNLYRRMLACICVSVGAAWIIIYFGIYGVRDVGRELDHARHLQDEPRQRVEGRVTLLKLKVRIRNSITLRKVRVETADGPVSLNLHADKTQQLKKAGPWLGLYTVHGYIVAYEVIDHADS